MDPVVSTSQSFIVKVWIEEPAGQDGQGVWHGHITHVQSGKRKYLKSLEEIGEYITPHLIEMGVNPTRQSRLKRLLSRLVRHTPALLLCWLL